MTPPAAPRTKATFAHEIQQEVLALSPDLSARVIDACGDVWSTIQDSLPSVWLEESTFNALTEGVRDQLGDDAMRDLYRRVGRVLSQNPFFRTGLEAMIRLSGMSPHTLLKFAPKARALVVRNAGTLVYRKVSNDEARLTMTGFPESTWHTGTTAIMLAGTWEGVVDLAHRQPTVEIQDLDLSGGSCVYAVGWA